MTNMTWIARFGVRILKAVGFVLALVVTGVVAWAFESRSLPDLKPWHRVELDNEFDADAIEEMAGLGDYLAREAALFDELPGKVYAAVEPADEFAFNRYYTGSSLHPGSFGPDYNRSFEVQPGGEIRCGVLLAHGLTDSPYSVRHLASVFTEAGCYAVALRMPGHGTIPVALTRVEFEDWQAAIALGVAAVRERIGANRPLFILGYSNGGALAVDYALNALVDESLPRVEELFLFSPMIGVTPFSRLANLGKVLSRIEYFEKFQWLDVQPEFDPFKYNSFPKAAGYETFLVTRELQRKLRELDAGNRLDEMPPVLTFQSLVDATVSTPAVLNELYARLVEPANELVLFDLNRASNMSPFLAQDHLGLVESLLDGPPLAYDLTLVGNASVDTLHVAERRRRPGAPAINKVPLDLYWPEATFSLSHVAMVFPPTDELYGTAEASAAAGLPALGALNPRGERGVTSVSVDQLVRIRHNPFYDYMAERVRSAIDARLAESAAVSPRTDARASVAGR